MPYASATASEFAYEVALALPPVAATVISVAPPIVVVPLLSIPVASALALAYASASAYPSVVALELPPVSVTVISIVPLIVVIPLLKMPYPFANVSSSEFLYVPASLQLKYL